MNEKIRALAEQCEVWHSYDDCDSCEVDIEVFAQLIIQECMEQCFSEDDEQRIAKYFGYHIEEEE
jgi:hypothetical protein